MSAKSSVRTTVVTQIAGKCQVTKRTRNGTAVVKPHGQVSRTGIMVDDVWCSHRVGNQRFAIADQMQPQNHTKNDERAIFSITQHFIGPKRVNHIIPINLIVSRDPTQSHMIPPSTNETKIESGPYLSVCRSRNRNNHVQTAQKCPDARSV